MTFPRASQMEPVSPLDHVWASSFVSGLLYQAKGAIFPLDVIACSGHMMPRQGNQQLAEDLVISQPFEDLGQEWLSQEAAILKEPRASVARAARGRGLEDLVEPRSEVAERSETGVELEEILERGEFLGSQARRVFDQEMRVVVEEILSPVPAFAGASALRGASLATAGVDLKLSADGPDRREEVHHLVVQEVEEAKLVLEIRPALEEGLLIETRPIRHGHADLEPSLLEKIEEAVHVALGVLGDDEEGNSEVIDRVGGHEDGASAIVDLVDTEGAREILESPLPVGGPVDLVIGPLEAVEDEADGDVQEEVLLKMGLDFVGGQVVADEKVDDLLSHPIGVATLEADALDDRREILGAGATGGVDAIDQDPEGGTLVSQVTHLAPPGSLAAAPLAAIWTGVPDRRSFLRLVDRVRFASGRTSRRTVSPHLPLSFSLDKIRTEGMLLIHSSDLENRQGGPGEGFRGYENGPGAASAAPTGRNQ